MLQRQVQADRPAETATRRIRDLPGPRGLPFLGNALQLDASRLHLIAEEWSRKYGEMYQLSIAGRRFLVLTNPETIATVLRDRPDGFQRTTRLNRVAREMGFGGVFSSNGEQWRRQRPMVMAAFDPAHIKSYFPALVKVTERFARRWLRAAGAARVIDLQADLMRYTVDVTAGLAFGTDINTLESEDEVIQSHLNKVLPAVFKRLVAPFDYRHWFKLPAERELQPHLAAIRHAVDDFIAQARSRMEREPARRAQPTNLIEAMIAARDAEGSGLDDTDVAGNVLTMLLAGEDTTANTLAWMIYLLSRNPPALERARNEVHTVLGTERVPRRYEDLTALAYVEACAHETMRLRPVAPLLMNEAVRDSVVAGVEVRKGEFVMCLMRPGATDARHFPQPQAFDPGRWLADPAGVKAASSAKRVSMPFGAGPRLCPGRYLALHEMKMVLAMLLAGFEIQSVDTTDGREPREHLALSMSPVGLRMRLKARP
ncbi:MAG TPA: cytochrome P450 [Burkholderiales bacterium]|nr:cytochrome P450 [Burkholderiales bacterium]